MDKYHIKSLTLLVILALVKGNQDNCVPQKIEDINKCNEALKTVYGKSIEECIESSLLNISALDLEHGPGSVEIFLIYPISTYLHYKIELDKSESDSSLTPFEREIIEVTQAYSERIIFDEGCLNFGITKATPQDSLAALKKYSELLYEESQKDIEDLDIISFFPQLDPYLLQSESRAFPVKSLFSSITNGYNNQIFNRRLSKLSSRTRRSK